MQFSVLTLGKLSLQVFASISVNAAAAMALFRSSSYVDGNISEGLVGFNGRKVECEVGLSVLCGWRGS